MPSIFTVTTTNTFLDGTVVYVDVDAAGFIPICCIRAGLARETGHPPGTLCLVNSKGEKAWDTPTYPTMSDEWFKPGAKLLFDTEFTVLIVDNHNDIF
jgi:hypothetical protein